MGLGRALEAVGGDFGRGGGQEMIPQPGASCWEQQGLADSKNMYSGPDMQQTLLFTRLLQNYESKVYDVTRAMVFVRHRDPEGNQQFECSMGFGFCLGAAFRNSHPLRCRKLKFEFKISNSQKVKLQFGEVHIQL